MNASEASQFLVALLDVSEKRYPIELAALHVNQSCAALSEENDVWFERFIFDYPYQVSGNVSTDPNLNGAIPVSDIINLDLNLGVGFLRNVFVLDGTRWKPLDGWEYRENLLTHNEQSGTPTNATIIGNSVLIRPIPEADCTIRLEVKGKPFLIGGTQTNGWLTHSPYATLYKAAMYASIYMMEDKMLAKFTAMFKDEAERAALHGSMMVMSEPRQAQEPG